MSQSTRLTSARTYESATNELPLSAISFTKDPDSPDEADKPIVTFDHYFQDQSHNEMSLLATNERPLSCTCLPKLLTDNDVPINIAPNSLADGGIDNEFLLTEPVLSASCPLPHGNFQSNENQIYSADFRERLNDYNAFREQKKSITPRIFINDKLPKKSSEFESTREVEHSDCVDFSDDDEFTNDPGQIQFNSSNLMKLRPIFKHSMLKKPIVFSSPQLSSNPCPSNAFSRTKHTMISTSSNSTASNIVTNVNNTTIPHPNIVKIHNSDATQTTQTSTTRRQRHSIAGQMGFFKIMDIAGGFSRKMATSTNSLFSTAVISGSSSAPNLHQINSTSPSGTNLLSTHFNQIPYLFPMKMKYGQENVLNMERFFANNLKSKNTHILC